MFSVLKLLFCRKNWGSKWSPCTGWRGTRTLLFCRENDQRANMISLYYVISIYIYIHIHIHIYYPQSQNLQPRWDMLTSSNMRDLVIQGVWEVLPKTGLSVSEKKQSSKVRRFTFDILWCCSSAATKLRNIQKFFGIRAVVQQSQLEVKLQQKTTYSPPVDPIYTCIIIVCMNMCLTTPHPNGTMFEKHMNSMLYLQELHDAASRRRLILDTRQVHSWPSSLWVSMSELIANITKGIHKHETIYHESV